MGFSNVEQIASAVRQDLWNRKGTNDVGSDSGNWPFLCNTAWHRQALDLWTVPRQGMWLQGEIPGPGSGVVCDNTTPGCWPYNQAQSGKELFVVRSQVGHETGTTGASSPGVVLFDRLWHNGGYSPADGGTKTVNSVPLPTRAGNGTGCWMFMYVYNADFAAGATITFTITYTNSSGVTGRTATRAVTTTTDKVNRASMIIPQENDIGVQSIQTISWTSAGSSSARFGLVIAKPLAVILKPSIHVSIEGRDHSAIGLFEMGLPHIPAGACLWPLFEQEARYSYLARGNLTLAEG